MDQVEELRVVVILAAAALLLGVVFSIYTLFYVSFALLVLGASSQKLTSWISKVWMKLARWFGTFNSKVLLTLVFYGFLTPFAWLRRLLSGRSLDQFHRQSEGTYLSNRDRSVSPEDFHKMW